MTQTAITATKSFDDPDEVIDLGKGTVHIVTLGGVMFDRSVFDPG